MERIKVPALKNCTFSTIIAIRITDLNYGGHVGNDAFLSLIHEARIRFLRGYGFSELDFAGTGLIMADAAIEFKRELVYGNEVKISVAVTAFDKLGFDIIYLMEVKEGDSWITAGKVKTGMLCYDYRLQKKVQVPPEAVEKLTK
jgi:acyl-CoA thioesterase FadM